MVSAWDNNAKQRHAQILAGKDTSFSKIMSPLFVRLVSQIKDIENSTILDIGCGSGILTSLLANKAKKVIGIDPSSISIEIAKESFDLLENVTFKCSPIEKFLPKNKFEVAVSHMAIQTITNLKKTFTTVSKLLEKQGVFIFSIPHPCFWAFYKPEIFKSNYIYSKTSNHNIHFTISNDPNPLPSLVPYHHRSIETYTSHLKNAGFQITQIFEPFPDKNIQKEYPSKWEYPHFMVFCCSKTTQE